MADRFRWSISQGVLSIALTGADGTDRVAVNLRPDHTDERIADLLRLIARNTRFGTEPEPGQQATVVLPNDTRVCLPLPDVELAGREWHGPHNTVEDGPTGELWDSVAILLAIIAAKRAPAT